MKTITQSTGKQFFALALASLLLLSGCSKNRIASSSSAESSSVATSQTVTSSTVSSQLQVQPAASSSEKVSSGNKPSVSSQTTASAPVGTTFGAIPASAKVSAFYFDDAVFIGDSVSLKLKNYVTIKRRSDPDFLGKAQFLVAGNMGSGNALQALSTTSIHPSYNGKKMLLEDSIAEIGAKKAYIMLGMNDIALYGIDVSVKNIDTLIGRIKAKSPQITIMVQSATPMIQDKQRIFLNNKNLYAYDQKLAALCIQKGYHFVNVAEVMRGKDGALTANYCSDPDDLGLHFTDIACQVWIEYLFTHTV